tara:strand:+ start:848 stop:3244 length:2397 start_codon:yes stop_codon:yes gene_type:complete
MSRLKSIQPAQNKYQGSSQGGSFIPVKTSISSKKEKEKLKRLELDQRLQRDNLARRQDASSLELKARQTANRGKLEVGHRQETARLKIESLYEESQLKLDSSFDIAKANLNTSYVQAKGNYELSKINLISKIATLSTSFASQVIDHNLKASKNQDAVKEANELFGLFNDKDTNSRIEEAKVEENNFIKGLFTNEKAIQKAADGDLILENSLREESQNETLARQTRKFTVNEAVQQAYPFFKEYLNSNEPITMPDGRVITPLTAQTREDINFIRSQAALAFAKEFSVSKMATDQVATVLLPAVKDILKAETKLITNSIVENRIEESKSNALQTATSDLASGKSADVVVEALTAELFASGEYRGSPGEANKAAVEHIIDYAEKTSNTVILDQLGRGYKVWKDGKPNTGTQYSKLFKDDIFEAKLNIDLNISKDLTNSAVIDQQAVNSVNIDRLEALTKDDITPEKIIEINQEAIQKLEDKNTDISNREAARLKNLGVNYSPFTFTSMLESAENGESWTNGELSEMVLSKELTLKEAKSLGYRPEQRDSVDTATNLKLEQMGSISTIDGLSANLITTSLGDTDLDPADLKDIITSDGESIANDVSLRMNSQLVDYVKDNPNATSQDIRNKLNEITQNMTQELSSLRIEDGEIKGYKYSVDSLGKLTTYTKIRENGVKYRIYSNKNVDDIKLVRSQINIANDQLLTRSELLTGFEAIQAGQEPSGRTKEVAKALGTNVRTLIQLQGKAYGIYEIQAISAPLPPKYEGEVTEANVEEVSTEQFGYPLTLRQYFRVTESLTDIK